MTKSIYNLARVLAWWFLAASWFWCFATPKGRRFLRGLRGVVVLMVEGPGEWNRVRLSCVSREAVVVYRLLRQTAFRFGDLDPFRYDNGVVWMPLGTEDP